MRFKNNIQDPNFSNQRPPSKNMWGVSILLIGTGLILLLRNLQLLPFEIPTFLFSWKIIPFVFATVLLIKGKFLKSIILFTVGIYLIAPDIFDVSAREVYNYWPVLLILFGLLSLTRKKKNCVVTEEVQLKEKSTLSNSVVFGGISRKINTIEFETGELIAVFGGIELDLSNCKVASNLNKVYLNVTAVFGGISLKIPGEWTITNTVIPIMGGYEENRSTASTENNQVEILISGKVIFGGVEIKRV